MFFRYLCILVMSTFFISSVWAFDNSFPEFVTLDEPEQAAFDRPSLFGPEYQSNMYSFMKPAEWEYDWLTHDVALDTSMGSISAVHFWTDTRAKLNHYLTPWLQFRFLHFDNRNLDIQTTHQIFELISWPSKKVGISLYGEPSYAKRENDIGIALILKPSETHEIRLFNTFVDITRQKRNDRTDFFETDALPYARGLVGRYWGTDAKKNFFEYALRYETPTRWRFPDENYRYRFWREFASLFLSQYMSPIWRLNWKLQADRKFEARDDLDPTSTITPEAWTTERLLVSMQTPIFHLLPEDWDFIPALQYAYRRWSIPTDTLIYKDILLGTFIKIPAKWFFNYSITFHGKSGGGIIGHPSDKNGATNQRLDIGYAFNFNKQAELRLQGGFDIDEFGTKDTWQAGSVQFRLSL